MSVNTLLADTYSGDIRQWLITVSVYELRSQKPYIDSVVWVKCARDDQYDIGKPLEYVS
jgi:hypothetical protein